MIDEIAAQLALRSRAFASVAATTGTTALSATATGYARASGSFLTDGFARGMEIVPTGFAANTVAVITALTATTIDAYHYAITYDSAGRPTVTTSAVAVESAASGRSIVAGIPSLRAYENQSFTPSVGIPYADEEFVMGPHALISGPAQGGEAEETGLYIVKNYVPSGLGVSALRKYAGAIKARFAPGTTITAGSNTVRVRGDTSTQTGQIIPLTSGWSAITVTIPWRAFSTNAIAA